MKSRKQKPKHLGTLQLTATWGVERDLISRKSQEVYVRLSKLVPVLIGLETAIRKEIHFRLKENTIG